MNYLTLKQEQFELLQPTKLEQFTSDEDGTSNPGGSYITQYVGYTDPTNGSLGRCVIKRIITNSTSGDLTTTFAYLSGEVNSLTFNKAWDNRASLTYQNFKI